MQNWVKANRKALNERKMKEERPWKFRELIELVEQYKRKIQYQQKKEHCGNSTPE